MTRPGWEGIYTGETRERPDDSTDAKGNVIQRWSLWAFADEGRDWADWDEEIVCINKMQEGLGALDDATRQIRAHIGSLVPCDCGFPTTVDELLLAIGRGKLHVPSFHNGCWYCGMWWAVRSPEPGHVEVMRTIQQALRGYLEGTPRDEALAAFPHATGFIERTYQWLGASVELTEVQRLMLERLLLPFGLWVTKPFWEADCPADSDPLVRRTLDAIEGERGRGAEIDAQLKGLGCQPSQAVPHKHSVCDCHHNTFRYLERWIHRIGVGAPDIPTRSQGTERLRIGRLLFGYSLAIDKWLLRVPMQFLLLDLGHLGLGFDPKNEVLRTYAYLGEDRTPQKEWLAASLWHSLTYNHIFMDPDYRIALGRAHQELIQHAASLGVCLREWMDSWLGRRPEYR